MKIQEYKAAEDIVQHWRQGKSTLDWRTMTIKGKIEWLKACLHWTGLPRQPIPAFDYIIDGNQIELDYDYYCLLGEVFFGYRGYFGMNLDAWYDCFSEIYIYEKNQTPGRKRRQSDYQKFKSDERGAFRRLLPENS